MKKLGFGCMRLPLTEKGNDETVDRAYASEMFDTFIERGFTYFDTAYMYHKSMSEKVVGECLVSRHERDSFLIASKMPVGMIEKQEDTDRIFADQKKKCNTEYFDYYLFRLQNFLYHLSELLHHLRLPPLTQTDDMKLFDIHFLYSLSAHMLHGLFLPSTFSS